MSLEGKRACVIGAGFGGLALAIRLQAAGVAVTLVEARDKAGGCAGSWPREGFTFEAGPTVIADPAGLRELWAITGHDIAADVELMPVEPLWRLSWPDGTTLDWSNDPTALRREIARLDPADIAGYDAFLDYAAAVRRDGCAGFGAAPFLTPGSLARAAPALVRHQAWRSVFSTVSRFVRDARLRQALSVRTLLAGGNPLTASGLHAPLHAPEPDGGVWWPRGGTGRLVAGMVRQLERLGGEVRLGDPVAAIETMGIRATEVETRGGWRARFDAVASNADIVHTYRDLLRSPRGPQIGRRLARKRFSASLFAVHFGIEGSWPGIPHHMTLFGPRYEELLGDIFERGVLPADPLIFLHHPTVTDPSTAPEGKSAFSALVAVPHLGKLAVDWRQVGPLLERRVLAEIERRLIPDLADRIVTKFHYTPRDLAHELGAHLGSAFSLEPTLTQSAWFRGHNRDAVIGNLYLVGAGTHPGAGVPGVLAGARATAGLMLEDLAR
ncbi:MAG TPA: phytoene desaturase [Croceibacterium sp.]|nr:phytoene desaturase [Croceibacterium sp.]